MKFRRIGRGSTSRWSTASCRRTPTLVAGGLAQLIEHSIAGSLCFGIYRGTKQAASRAVGDRATFAGWRMSLMLPAPHAPGRGPREVAGRDRRLAHPDLRDLRRWILGTATPTAA